LAAQSAESDSLVAAARRAARAWRAHDFEGLLAGATTVQVQLPGAEPSAPLRVAQVVELLRTFTEGAEELDVEVQVARVVDGDRAYVEIQRVFRVRGTEARRAQTMYVGLRRVGAAFRASEIRVVP
jgi:hypothetical protein